MKVFNNGYHHFNGQPRTYFYLIDSVDKKQLVHTSLIGAIGKLLYENEFEWVDLNPQEQVTKLAGGIIEIKYSINTNKGICEIGTRIPEDEFKVFKRMEM